MSQVGSPDSNTGRASPSDSAVSAWTLAGVAACFALSGFAALLYQTAWMRQFSLVFGTSELAVATVLAAYMAGLALGAHVIERFLPRVSQPVLVYGVIEFAIAASALAVPLLLLGAERLMAAVLGGQPAPPDAGGWLQPAFYLLTAFVVLAVPTALTGTTLPLLARHAVRTTEHIGVRTGLLYAINAGGAVAGALAAGFVLLPQLGLRDAVFVGALINVVVFCLAVLLARSPRMRASHRATAPTLPASSNLAARFTAGRHWILPFMFASGAVSFVYEVLWTRMLSHVLGGSVQAFATMVAAFLLGIALGSAMATRGARTRAAAQLSFIASQLAIAVASIGVYFAFDMLVPHDAGLRGNVGLAIAVMLPATLFVGATFPPAVRILTDEVSAAAGAAARVYAWNTAGCIAGALLAGFLLIPSLRFEGTIYVAVLMNLAIALLVCLLVVRAPLLRSAAVACLAAIVAVTFRPEIPRKLLVTSPLNVVSKGEIRYYDVGRSATVLVLEQDGALMLRTNGLPEAMIDMPGAAPRFSGEFWLSPLAVMARPRAESMLVVGYGGGIAVDGVPPTVRSVDVIELEPKVMEANRAVRSLRARDPLLDPRVTVILNDARGALSLSPKTYDAIVSHPSHPWTAGASHLYTREFMQVARAHLSEGGVFVQWMNISFLDESLLRSLAATLLDVFGQVRLYRPDPNTLVFLASVRPLELETALARQGIPFSEAPRHYARFGIHVIEDLVTALVADQEGVIALARGAELITDDRNRMATAAAYDRGRGLTTGEVSAVLAQYDPLQRRGSWIFRSPSLGLSFAYIARRIALHAAVDPGMTPRIARMARLIPDSSVSAHVQAIALRKPGSMPASMRLLGEAVALDPANHEARFELVQPWLPALARGRAPERISALARDLPSSAQALLEAGRHAVAQDWAKLPPLDATLRTARWTDAWYFECVQMRAEWRARVTHADVRLQLGREALALVDEAIVSQPTPAMFAVRARSAIAADRPDVLLESIASLAQGTLHGAALGDADLPKVRGSLEGLIETIDRIGADARVDSHRRAEVRAAILDGREQIMQKEGASMD